MSNDMFPDSLVKYLLENPMPTKKAHYDHYHRPGLTDESVFKKESEWRFEHGGWTSVLHQHSHLSECNDKCKIFGLPHIHSEDCASDCDLKTEWAPVPAERIDHV